jgi:hypothetical protein
MRSRRQNKLVSILVVLFDKILCDEKSSKFLKKKGNADGTKRV